MLEVEAKIRIRDARRLRGKVLGQGARRVGVDVQEDTYFAHPGRDLAARDEALRLRRIGKSFELTYKGPRQAGPNKARQEENLDLDRDPTALLLALGFRPSATLRKRRETFVLDGATVAIDRLPGLGDFAEVEVVSTNAKAAARRVEQVLAALGLAEEPRVRESYLELALAEGAAAATRV